MAHNLNLSTETECLNLRRHWVTLVSLRKATVWCDIRRLQAVHSARSPWDLGSPHSTDRLCPGQGVQVRVGEVCLPVKLPIETLILKTPERNSNQCNGAQSNSVDLLSCKLVQATLLLYQDPRLHHVQVPP